MIKTFSPLLLLLFTTPHSVFSQTQLTYLGNSNFAGVHIYQDSVTKYFTIVAGSNELKPNPTFIYQLDSSAHLLSAKKLDPQGRNITSSAASNQQQTVLARTVENTTGQVTANLVSLDRKSQVQWSIILESYNMTFVNALRLGKSGSVFIAGNGITSPPRAKNYSFLGKISSYGERVWDLTDFTKGDTVAFRRLAVDNQDTTYGLGKVDKKALLSKIDPRGDVAWQQSVWFRGETRLYAIAVDRGFVYVLGADEVSFSREGQVFVSKINTAGKEVWTMLINSPSRFLPDDACLEMTPQGDLVLAIGSIGADRQRAWVTIQMDAAGGILQAAQYQRAGFATFPRDLVYGKNANFVGTGALETLPATAEYPFFFRSTTADLLAGKSGFSPFTCSQKSIHLELLPAHIDFVNQVMINTVDFPLEARDNASTVNEVKE
ncbi:MAG: hypothetical protein ABIO24_02920 [Saprospiraceae bacterium]